jgi:hypothetical protein
VSAIWRSEAKSFDGLEDVVGGFCPSEWARIFIVDFDESSDVGFEVLGRAMDSASDLLFG